MKRGHKGRKLNIEYVEKAFFLLSDRVAPASASRRDPLLLSIKSRKMNYIVNSRDNERYVHILPLFFLLSPSTYSALKFSNSQWHSQILGI